MGAAEGSHRLIRVPTETSALRRHVAEVLAKPGAASRFQLSIDPRPERFVDVNRAGPSAGLRAQLETARRVAGEGDAARAPVEAAGRPFISELEAGKSTAELGLVLGVLRALGLRLQGMIADG